MRGFKILVLLICLVSVLGSCDESVDEVPAKAEVVLKQVPAVSNAVNPNSGPTIQLYCGPSRFKGDPPLVIIVENGVETVLEGNLSDVDLQSISRYEVVKPKDLKGKYEKYADIIKLHDGFLKLYMK